MENFHWLNAVAGVSLAILGFFLKTTYNRMIALETITNNGINQLNVQIAKLNENFKNLNSERARYDKLEERTRLLEQRIAALESHDS
jgi:cell shape-determining protein MreC